MKLLSFDLESARITEEGEELVDVGISCAGIVRSDATEYPAFYHMPGRLGQIQAHDLVLDLIEYAKAGYTIITWNGTSFDFRVLSEVSGAVRECAELAMNHVDMMLLVTFQKGYYLGLDTALRGMGLPEKVHAVTLKDGTVLEDFRGKMVPKLWAAGEYEAVLKYLKGDIEQPLELAQKIIDEKAIRWMSGKGNPMKCHVREFWAVKDLFKLPKPNTSWMTDPPTREMFVRWMKV